MGSQRFFTIELSAEECKAIECASRNQGEVVTLRAGQIERDRGTWHTWKDWLDWHCFDLKADKRKFSFLLSIRIENILATEKP